MRKIFFLSILHFALTGYILVSHVSILKTEVPNPLPAKTIYTRGSPEVVMPFTGGNDWFKKNKQFCNTLEIDTLMKKDPPSSNVEGKGYQAACYILAARIEEADKVIMSVPQQSQAQAAGIVFNVGHPIADSGDDKSAGPIMNLVLKYWPENYQAVYHAGMSEFALKQYSESKVHLNKFLTMYKNNDYFHQTAVKTLEQLDKEF